MATWRWLFQSSPAPRRGCCTARVYRRGELSGFNPHPRRGAGAAALRLILAHEVGVSILTRAEARVLPQYREDGPESFQFQSSPAPRRGCCIDAPKRSTEQNEFQSSPAPRRGCCGISANFVQGERCFNPHPRRGAGAAGAHDSAGVVVEVSILTRAEARVLLARNERDAADGTVSILTRAEARVLPFFLLRPKWSIMFQSSPAPRRGCCEMERARTSSRGSFNPHPRRGAGAACGSEGGGDDCDVSILTRAEARVLLCITSETLILRGVSILTRAEARVLQEAARPDGIIIKFQSSPAPRRGCCRPLPARAASQVSFNPHPRRGAGAASASKYHAWPCTSFNPHPRRGAGAARARHRRRTAPGVSILTRAEARVLPSASNAMNCNV